MVKTESSDYEIKKINNNGSAAAQNAARVMTFLWFT